LAESEINPSATILVGLKHSYRAFGLSFESDIDCGLAPSDSGDFDVSIRLGEVPDHLSGASGHGVLYDCTPSKFLLKIEGVARYLVSDGRTIVIQPERDADFESVSLFLSGSVFGALLHQRRVLTFHASAVVTRSGAVLFAGLSGCGKSTVAGALHQKGYPVLTDELCAIDTHGTPRVFCGAPALLLWADGLRSLGLDSSQLRPVRPQLAKFVLPLGDGFITQPVPLRAIYVLEIANAGISAPRPIKGMEKIEVLARNAYRPHFVAQMALEGSLIRPLAAVARSVPVARVDRPRGPFPVNELVDLLERDLEG
jgi:hypothetical protein